MRPLSVKVTTWVWEHSRSREGARLVLLAIGFCVNSHDSNAEAWPSIPKLAAMTGLSERTVYRAIRELEALGELEIRANAGPRRGNRYRVLMPTPNPCQDVTPDKSSPLTSTTPDNLSPLTSTTPTPDNLSSLTLTSTTVPYRNEPEVEPEENRKNNTSASQPSVVTIRPDVDRLCDLLADGVQATTGERPKVNKRGWTDPARLLLDRDGYTAEQVEALIVWTQQHDFWRTHILSMSKLRDKRLTLIAQARRDGLRRAHEPASWAALREL